MITEVRIPVSADADVVVARQQGRDLAHQAELSMIDAALVAAAISELARNILLFATRGEMVLTLVDQVDQDGRRGIIVTAIDEGPGIPDVARALQDGYSTSGGLGLGLPGVKRVMDEFDITSHVGRGTTVTAKKWKREEMKTGSDRAFIEWGIAGVPVTGEQQSGDRGLVRSVARGALVAVVDGLGHGDAAAAAAERAVDTLRGYAGDTLIALLQRCHEATRGTRGVAIGLAMIHETRGTLTWLGVGNVAGVVMSRPVGHAPQRQALFQRAGIVGVHLPPLAQAIVPLRPRDLLIVGTDGIRTDAQWRIPTGDRPQSIADRMLAEYRKETDDALVLVLRYLGRGARL